MAWAPAEPPARRTAAAARTTGDDALLPHAALSTTGRITLGQPQQPVPRPGPGCRSAPTTPHLLSGAAAGPGRLRRRRLHSRRESTADAGYRRLQPVWFLSPIERTVEVALAKSHPERDRWWLRAGVRTRARRAYNPWCLTPRRAPAVCAARLPRGSRGAARRRSGRGGGGPGGGPGRGVRSGGGSGTCWCRARRTRGRPGP